MCSTLCKKAEDEFYTKIFADKVNNTKFIWKQINELCSFRKNTKNSTVISKLTVNGKVIEDKLNISNAINLFFSEIGAELSKKIALDSNINNYRNYIGNPQVNSCFLDIITENEIFNIIRSMKSKNSSGPDNLPFSIYANHSDLLCSPLCYLFYLSLDSGVVPNCLKIAKIIPIYKKR